MQKIMKQQSCGLWIVVLCIRLAESMGLPLKAYEDLKAFKLFVADVGLLGCIRVHYLMKMTFLLSSGEH